MAVTYNINKSFTSDTRAACAALEQFLQHVTPLGIIIRGLQVKPDGTLIIQTETAIPAEQVTHLGLT